MIVLRPYQTAVIDRARDAMRRGVRRMILVSPTGSGKTVMAADILRRVVSNAKRAYVIVHRRELVRQTSRTLTECGIPHGLVAAGAVAEPEALVQVAAVQTLVRRDMPRADLIIWDEAHHAAARSWRVLFDRFGPQAWHIGLTATPARLDGHALGPFFDEIIEGPSVSQLIGDGWLARYRVFAPFVPDRSGLTIRAGEFKQEQSRRLMHRADITGNALDHYRRHLAGKRAIIFATGIDHSRSIVDTFVNAGIPAAHVDGETSPPVRDQAVRDFAAGDLLILSNVSLFGEGFDVPAAEGVIILRPTASIALHLQMIGRVMRPGKTAIILDHAGNTLEHGFPDDHREWSLEGRIARKTGNTIASPRICVECFAAYRRHLTRCPYCDHVAPADPRPIRIDDRAELVELDRRRISDHIAERKRAKTLDDLIELGIRRGYRNPRAWAKHVHNGRNRDHETL